MSEIEGKSCSEKANWKFDASIVPVFDEHVRQSVPLYEELHRMSADISSWFIEDGTNIYDIGTSTGEAIQNLLLMHPNRDVNYIGIDSSISMVEKTKKRFVDKANVSILQADITKDNCPINNACFINSILTLQFISPSSRSLVIDKIYHGLNKGGGFVMVEKVIGNNARFDEIWIELYHELKLKNGISEKEVFAKSRAIRGVMRPYTIDENITMLKDSGFNDIDIFLKWGNFVGFLAMK